MTDYTTHASPAAAPVPPTASSVAAGFGHRHRRSFMVAIVIGAIMAVLAPLQTNYISFWPRLAFWQILMISGATIGLGVTEGMRHWGRLSRWPWIEIPVTGLLIALPLTMIVIGSSSMFFGISSPGTIRFSFNFGVTALISIAITALNHMISNGGEGTAVIVTPPAESESDSIESSRFADRLPLPLRHLPINALQAEDHYLRVHLGTGQSTLILMRLSDAIAELPANQGTQTHRSWWVAREAVRAVTKSDGRATLSLNVGVEVPVSRTFYKRLNDGGWLS